MKYLITILMSLFLVNCANTRQYYRLNEEQLNVEVGHSDVSRDMVYVGTVVAVSGNGCGGFGTKGTAEKAYNLLRIKADNIYGTYVKILTVKEPTFDIASFCLDNEYKITGLVYKPKEKE